MQFIAEVKTHSPFGWQSNKSWDELFEIANQLGDIISIHTDPRWHGSFDLLRKARGLTRKPILAKGIHTHDTGIEEALKAGADYVLVVGRLPNVHIDVCFIEPHDIAQLQSLNADLKAVWNSRDLKTGGLKPETFEQARKAFPGWLCQASNVRSPKDINPTANAVLVGTHLENFLPKK